MLANQSQSIEADEKHLKWAQPNSTQNLGFAAAAVIIATAALEAAINEIYDRAADKRYPEFSLLTTEQVDLIAQLWSVVEMSAVLKKHDIALVAAGLPRIDPGSEPCQSAKALAALRDTILHYKPE